MDCENYRLNAGSPCIDTASDAQSPPDDRVNVLRPQDGDGDNAAIADMGAYEYTELTPPLALTIHYDSLPPSAIDEDTMALYHWDVEREKWVALTVLGRDTTANTLTVQLDHLSELALLGTAQQLIYLPMVVR